MPERLILKFFEYAPPEGGPNVVCRPSRPDQPNVMDIPARYVDDLDAEGYTSGDIGALPAVSPVTEPEPAEEPDWPKDDDEEGWADLYRATTGNHPHGNWKLETIIAKTKEAVEAKSDDED